tara:strand:+ start:96451 stop:97908 length:1458 start_codon:yes stop_codon:yes gene_type:complete
MSALMVSANTGSVINAAQINHRNSLSSPEAQTTGSQVSSTKISSTQTTSSKISSTQTNNAQINNAQVNNAQVNTTQAITTKSIDTQSAAVQSNWVNNSLVNNSSLKSSSNSIQAAATSTFNASKDLKVNLPSTDTQPGFSSSFSDKNDTQSQKIVGADPLHSYNFKSGPLNLAGVLNRSQTQVQAPGAVAPTSVGTGISTSTSKSDTANTQQPAVNHVNKPSVSSATPINDTAGTALLDDSKATAEPQASNTQDEGAANQVEQKVATKQQQIERAETIQIDQLTQRDTEVKTHEQAHAAIGGSLAQSPSYQYEKGPDGRRYVVDGEVNIDVSTVDGDSQATLSKMQKVYAAAMAPVQPSMADIHVAAQALKNINDANQELIQQSQQNTGSTQKSQNTSESSNLFTASDNQPGSTSITHSHNPIAPNSRTLTINDTLGADETNMNLLSSRRPLSAEQGHLTVANETVVKGTHEAEINSARQIEIYV